MRRLPAPLLLVTDRRAASRDLIEVVAGAFAAGCRWVSLREKDLAPARRRELVLRLRREAEPHGAVLGVHDDLAAAAELGLGALHLPSGGDVREARARLGKGVLIGISAHDRAELEAAAARGADYATLGPVAPSISKPGHAPRQNLQELAELARRVSLPVLALGGVTAATARPLLEAGFAGVAVTGAVMAAPDPAAAARGLLAALGEPGSGVWRQSGSSIVASK